MPVLVSRVIVPDMHDYLNIASLLTLFDAEFKISDCNSLPR